MKYKSQLWSVSFLQKGAKVAAGFVISAGCLVLIGWFLDISFLKSILPYSATMKANTALCFILSGTSLLLSAQPIASQQRQIVQFCSLVVAALGLATLCEYLWEIDLGIDQLLIVDEPQPIRTLSSGRMSPLTAICFVFVSIALWLSTAKKRSPSSRLTPWVERLAILTCLIATQSIVAYIYEVRPKIGFTNYSQMALHTAICFVVLAIGILLRANPDQGVMGIITADSAGGVILRQLLPVAIAIPLILGWFRVTTAQIGLFDPDFGTSVLAVLHIVALTGVIAWNAQQLHRLDVQRQSAMRAVSLANDELEIKIQERTAELAEQAQLLQQQADLLELTNEAIFVRDQQGAITYWNRGAEAKYGWTKEEAIGRMTQTLLQTKTPDDINLDRTLLQQESWQGELIHTCKDGRQIIVDSRQVLIRDRLGSAIAFLEVNRDITERKIAEKEILNLNQELQRQLAESQTLLEVLPIGVAIALDPLCKKIRVNSALAQMLALAPTDNASLSAPAAERPTSYKVYQNQIELAPEDLPIQRAAAQGIELRDLEINVVWHDGTTLTLLGYAAPLFDEDGRTRGSIGAFLNITERKQAEAALQNSLKDLADLKFALDQSSIVAITNAQGIITYINDKFCELSQYSPAELIGQTHRIINSGYHPKEFFQQMWATITKGQVWYGEIKNRAKNGTYYWVATTIVPFLNSMGKPYQYIAIRSDITNRKAAEAQLQQLNMTLEQRVEERTAQLQEANKDLEAFSYTIAHDLRAPLRGIQGFAQALAEDYGEILDETATEYIQYIFDGTERMNNLVSDLLAYSRLSREQIHLVPVQLTSVVTEAIAQLDGEVGKHHAEITVAQNLPPVWGHRSILVQVLVNLLANAIKFVANGVQPHIRVWAEILGAEGAEGAEEVGEWGSRGVGEKKRAKEDISYQSPVTSQQSPVNSQQSPVTSQQSPVTSHQSPVTSHQSPVNSHQSPVTSQQSPVNSHQSPVNSQQSPVNSHQSPVTTTSIQNPKSKIQNSLWVRLWVEDNGIGVDPAYQEQIFGVFERLHGIDAYPGTGIGLAIVRKGAERLGGRAGVESVPGQGSRFWIELPEGK